jgi:branched-chain amino acid transport system ATP-binding protein
MSLLQVRSVTAGFGQQTILHAVDLEVPDGGAVGLFGLNGAGKSVLLKVIAGLVPVRAGRVEFDGADISRLLPERRVALGLGHVPQGRQVFKSLSVEQNLRVGAYPLRRRARRAYADTLARIYDTFPVLAQRRTQRAGTLSGGQQATLAVARALMSNPRLLLIDEPSAGLAPSMVEHLFQALLSVRATGLTMVLVEQNIAFGLSVAETACLLQRGRVVYTGSVENLDEQQLATHLGVGRLLEGGPARLERRVGPPPEVWTAGALAQRIDGRGRG